jgi:hypothetical protein
MNAGKITIEADTKQAVRAIDRLSDQVKNGTENVHAMKEAMEALSRATNSVPFHRLEWLAVCFICSQTIGNLALLGIAVALLRGH